jgi:hypothetical protein
MERKSGAHAPTPWSHYDDTGPDGKTGRHEIVAIGKTVARIYATKGMEAEDAANAALIVKAVNAFDPLVSALEVMLAQTDPYRQGRNTEAELEARANAVAALSLAKDGTK